MKQPKVIISNDVIQCLTSLPSAIKSKSLEFMLKFQTNPRSPGINYETIQGAKDKNFRSVRIDHNYRGIISCAPADNVFIWLHIGKHDDAYAWAIRKKFYVNSVTGSFALTDVTYVEQTVRHSRSLPPTESPPNFQVQSDRELIALGVPDDTLPAVRTLRSEDDLDEMRQELPVEAYEGLFLILAGDSVSKILEDRETSLEQVIDIEDFAQAAVRDESRSRFYVVEGETDLQEVLSAPLEKWRVFLHPTQRRLATWNVNGPSRILGGAGTGKTVLAMHRAKYLASNLEGTDKKVLFTTFTRNLALDIEDGLKSICTDQQMQRIEVINLDALMYRFLKSERYEHQIVFNFKEKCQPIWDNAMTALEPDLNIKENLVRDEFEQVVLAQGIATRDEYREVSRRGRGFTLSRKERDALWEIFDAYRLALTAKGLKELDDAYRDACSILQKRAQPPYAHAVVDETQDFGSQALRLIRALVQKGANDLMFAGDGHQRIYPRNKTTMSSCGIDIRGRSRKLYLNYRTTEEIRKEAISLLEGVDIDDLDGGSDEMKRYKSLMRGEAPRCLQNASLEQIFDELNKFIKEFLSENAAGLKVGIMAPTAKLRDQIGEQIRQAGFKVVSVDRSQRLSRKNVQVYVMTLHRAKGLEFDAVAIVVDSLMDEYMRKLVYVGMTRAKRSAQLYLTQQ